MAAALKGMLSAKGISRPSLTGTCEIIPPHGGAGSIFPADEVIAVDQSGHPAQQIAGGFNPVWTANVGDGTYYVALFNLNAFPSPMQVKWTTLGFTRASSVRDLWNSHRSRAI
jgi:hypothetical protein